MPASRKEFLDIQAIMKCRFIAKRVCGMIKTPIILRKFYNSNKSTGIETTFEADVLR